MIRPMIVAAVLLTSAAVAGCDSGDDDGGGKPKAPDALVREPAQDLSAAEKKTFTDAVLELKKMPSPFKGYEDLSYYDTFVQWHKDAFNCDEQTAHMGPNFLPWHRHFLILFEEALSEGGGEAGRDPLLGLDRPGLDQRRVP